MKLTNDRFQIAEAARHGMHRKNIAIPGRRQRDKAKVDHIAGEGWVILNCHPRKRIGHKQADDRKEGGKSYRDTQVDQDGSGYAMMRDASRGEYRSGNETDH